MNCGMVSCASLLSQRNPQCLHPERKKKNSGQPKCNILSSSSCTQGGLTPAETWSALGPLKEYGMSLLNGAQSEVCTESEGRAAAGRRLDTRHETLRGRKKKWMSNESGEKVDGVKRKLWAELRRITGDGVCESRVKGEEETTKSQGKVSVKDFAAVEPIYLFASSAPRTHLMQMRRHTLNVDAGGCLGLKSLCFQRCLKPGWVLFFADWLFYGCYFPSKRLASTPVPCGLFWTKILSTVCPWGRSTNILKLNQSYKNPQRSTILCCFFEETLLLYKCHTCT